MPTSLDFKLIAVRVLSGCVQHIRKCLVENHFYYLNNDYRISEEGKLITRRSSNIAPLSASFFSLSEKQSKGVRLNFSAIVGMNGEGKSSLVSKPPIQRNEKYYLCNRFKIHIKMESKEYFEKVMQDYNPNRKGHSLRKYCKDETVDYDWLSSTRRTILYRRNSRNHRKMLSYLLL